MLPDWRDRDLPELDRARSLLAMGDTLVDDGDDGDGGEGVVDHLVDLLNEPLAILPRLAAERLRQRGGVVVMADTFAQRLRRCRHDVGSLMADADSEVTGRRTCADCGGTVVAFDAVVAIARDLEGCALFRGPALPWPSAWLRLDERHVERKGERPITIGGGPLDDVTNAGLPAGALTIRVGDDVLEVQCAPGLSVVAPSPSWLLREPPSVAGLAALARHELRAPFLTDLVVFRDGDPSRRAVTVTVDAADPFAIEVLWRGFSAQQLLRVGDVVPLSFDGALRALRSGTQVLIQTRTAPFLVDLPPGERVDLPFGAATATWRGRQLELVGCPPPVARAPQVNLLANLAAHQAHGVGGGRR